MLYELALFDKAALPYEFVDEKFIYKNFSFYKNIQHPRHKLKLGAYSDDTQMSIALIELILSGKEWNHLNIANSFIETFKRDPINGYARRFQKFLEEVQSGQEFLDKIQPNSIRNGAAMRATPIGIYKDISKVIEYATIQAEVTHNTEIGINSACAAALLAHYFIYNLGLKKDVGKFINKYIPGEWDENHIGRVPCHGTITVQAAITAIKQSNNMKDLLKRCIYFTGDTDSVATIAAGAASWSNEIKQNIPLILKYSLRNDKYGRNYIINLDKKFMKLKGQI